MADLEMEDEDLGEQGELDLSEPESEGEDFDLWEEELAQGTSGTSMEEEDPEELEHQRDSSERAKISLPETIIFGLLALFTDSIEFLAGFANILPVVGQAIWFMVWIFGIFVSIIILLWTFIRGVHGRYAIKIAITRIIGFLLDAALIGWLPIRTVVLLVTIWLNNHLENKEIDRLVGLLSKVKI